MAIPITVTCECGAANSALLGDDVVCACGRRYETGQLPPERFAHIKAKQVRVRLYMQLGLAFVGGITVLAAVVWGFRGVALATPLSGLLWFLFVGKWFRRRWLRDLYETTSLHLEASER